MIQSLYGAAASQPVLAVVGATAVVAVVLGALAARPSPAPLNLAKQAASRDSVNMPEKEQLPSVPHAPSFARQLWRGDQSSVEQWRTQVQSDALAGRISSLAPVFEPNLSVPDWVAQDEGRLDLFD